MRVNALVMALSVSVSGCGEEGAADAAVGDELELVDSGVDAGVDAASCLPTRFEFLSGPYPPPSIPIGSPFPPLTRRPVGEAAAVLPNVAGHDTQNRGMYWLIGDEAPEFIVDVAFGTSIELEHDWRFSIYVDGVPVEVDADETPLHSAIDMSTGIGQLRFALTPAAVPMGAHTVHYVVDLPDYFGVAGWGVTVFRDSHEFRVFEQTPGAEVQARRDDIGVLVFPGGGFASGTIDPTDAAFTLDVFFQPFDIPLLECPERTEQGVIFARLDGEHYPIGPDPRGAYFGVARGGTRLTWPLQVIPVPVDGQPHRLVLYYVSGIGVANEEVLGSGESTPGTLSARNITNLRWPTASE